MTDLSRLGVIGVGNLSAAMVAGWCRSSTPPTQVVVSPRGAAHVARLTSQFDLVRRAADNQQVIDESGVVLLAVRPGQLDDALDGLTFGAEQLIVSAIATVGEEQLRVHVGAGPTIVRVIPMPAAAYGASPTVVFPEHQPTEKLMRQLGPVFATSDQPSFDALTVATATVAAQLAELSTVSAWLGERGVGEPEGFVRAMFSAVATSLTHSPDSLDSLLHEAQTPGGLNDQYRRATFTDREITQARTALDAVYTRVNP